MRSAGSSPGCTTALTVTKAASPLRQSESSGRTIEPGDSEDHVDEDAAVVGSKAKPPTQTGPAPAGKPRGSSTTACRSVSRHSRPTSSKATLAPRGRLVGDAERCQRESRSGCSQQNQRSDASREAKTTAQGSTPSTGTVTLTSVRRPRARRSLDSLAQAAE